MRFEHNRNSLYCAAALAMMLSGCAWPGRQRLLGSPDEPVRRVEWNQKLDLQPYAERARQLGKEVYPQIVALLGVEGTVPPHFDIVFDRLRPGWVAVTYNYRPGVLSRIAVSTDSATNNLFAPHIGTAPSDFDVVMVHEMAHVAQQCKFTWRPKYWVEGIADYVNFRLGYTNATHTAECTRAVPHYNSGYSCTGAFLLFVEGKHGTNVVRQLLGALPRGAYTDGFFVKETGRTLDVLWAEFQGTSSYTPEAARMNKLNTRLGFVEGKPPKDLAERFDAYVKSLPGGTNTVAALHFMEKLANEGRLPGFSKRNRPVIMRGENYQGSFVMPDAAHLDSYPLTRKLYCYDRRHHDIYWYVVARSSEAVDWELTNAFRTDRENRLVETYK